MPYVPTSWVDSSSPDIDAANLNNIETGISKAPYGPDASANQVAVWNGSAWVYQKIAAAQISSTAAIPYGSLSLAGSIVNADVATGAAVAYAKLNLAAAIKDSDVAAAQNLTKLSGVTGTPDGTKFLSDAGSWLKPAGLTTYRKNSATTVNNTVTETDLLASSVTVAAGAMGTTGVLRLTAWGDHLANNGTTVFPRLKAKLGGTTLIDTGTLVAQFGASATRYPWRCTVEIENAGAANSQIVNMRFEGVGAFAAATQHAALTTGEGLYWNGSNNPGPFYAHGYNTSAVDTTAAAALVLSVILPSASVNVEMKLVGALVEII